MLIDNDDNGFVDLSEFVSGCMQLRGPAKSLQVAKMSYETGLHLAHVWCLLMVFSVDPGLSIIVFNNDKHLAIVNFSQVFAIQILGCFSFSYPLILICPCFWDKMDFTSHYGAIQVLVHGPRRSSQENKLTRQWIKDLVDSVETLKATVASHPSARAGSKVVSSSFWACRFCQRQAVPLRFLIGIMISPVVYLVGGFLLHFFESTIPGDDGLWQMFVGQLTSS